MKADFGLQNLEKHPPEFIFLGESYLRDARSEPCHVEDSLRT
jgi:hypothetical protein